MSEERTQSPTADGEVGPYAAAAPFRRPQRVSLLNRAIPLSEDLPKYRPHTARGDVVAGLTVAALALPSAMAFGELAGLSPVRGLYALLLPTVAYVLLGSSKQLIIGPEGSVSTLVGAAILPLAVAGSSEAGELAAMLALLVAACFLVARVARLGWIGDYFSRPVLIGYIHGVVVVLIIAQLGKLLGLDISARDPLPRLGEVVRELGSVSGTTVLVSVVSLAVLIPLRFRVPKFPTPLVVVIAGLAFSWALSLDEHGVAVVGTIPSGLPSFDLPLPPLRDALQLVPAAIGIFAVSFADEILTARSFAGKSGQHVRASQELLTMGAANAAAGFTQGFPIGASGSRTAVNDSMGARTQVAGLVLAGTVVLILLFLTNPIQYLPTAVLAAVIVSAGIGLVDVGAWRALWTTDRVEVAIAGVTTAGVVLVGVLQALALAVGLTIIDVVRRSARPHDAVLGWVERLGRWGDVSIHRSARITPGVVVYRLDDRLFFANARYVKGRVREAVNGAPGPTLFVVFGAEAMTYIDSTGLEALEELGVSLRDDSIQLVFARLKRWVRQEFDDSGLTETIGPEWFYPSVRTAVAACVAKLEV
jgi:sulfate permease, SulP family